MKPSLVSQSQLKFLRTASAAAVIALLGATFGAHNLCADTLVVTSTADDGSVGTLRAALNSAANNDTIDATGIAGIITLQPNSQGIGQLVVGKSVIIFGPGPDKLTIDANHQSRVFLIVPGLSVTIDGLTITNGSVSGPMPAGGGGAIYNDHATLTVSNCRLIGNAATFGGAIASDGTTATGSAVLTMVDCTLRGNSATSIDGESLSGSGGALFNYAFNDGLEPGGVSATLLGCTLSGNSASQNGGGIRNGSQGGASPSKARLVLINCTLTGNSAIGLGGGIESFVGDVTVLSSTFSGNAANSGSGSIYFDGRLTIGNSILKAGSPGGNISTFTPLTATSLGFNLSSHNDSGILSGLGDLNDTDPMLGPLADNGGPTQTHLPLPGSPAIDRGSSDSLAPFAITIDQRGFARTVDDPNVANAAFSDGTDIGAVEVAAAPPPTSVADVAVSFLGADKVSVKHGEVLTYTIAVRNFGPNTAPNVVLNSLLSTGTGFLNARATKGSFSTPPVNETGSVIWNLGDMANGSAEGAELVVSVLVKGKTTVTNLVAISSDAEDPHAENNVASITTSVSKGGGGNGGKK